VTGASLPDAVSGHCAADTPSRRRMTGAVLAMTLCAGALIASEFLPVSLLTPVAADLRLTQGQAGQAISVSGVFAVLTSLFVSGAVGRMDRRAVLLGFSVLMIVSGVIVAVAPNVVVLTIGRALLGMAIGGFWSMSTATVMRIVPRDEVPRALAILNGGNALAATVAAPVGSFLGGVIGWRGAFFCVVPLAVTAFLWLRGTLPPLPAERRSGAGAAFRLLGRPPVALGMAAILFLFMGQFAMFTYLRPFLETVTQVDVPTLSLILLILGVTGLIGTYAVGWFLRRRPQAVLIAIPLGMAAIGAALMGLGHALIPTVVLLAAWGLIATPAPVGWGTWLSRTLPQDAEAGGGLMVATIQLGITLGASVGGLLFDLAGYRSTFGAAAAMLVASAVLALLSWRGRASLATSSRPTCRPRPSVRRSISWAHGPSSTTTALAPAVSAAAAASSSARPRSTRSPTAPKAGNAARCRSGAATPSPLRKGPIEPPPLP
jgi:predicted MFS family arabinose efflux permease